MNITLSPSRSDLRLDLSRNGSLLTLNGETIDLSTYDAEAAPSDWIIGQPAQVGGVWDVRILFPHGAGAPEEARFPALITLVGNGPVVLPSAEPMLVSTND